MHILTGRCGNRLKPPRRIAAPMGFEVLATTAGVAVLMGVLPRALFALRLGRTEGLAPAHALALLVAAGALTVYGAWAGHLAATAANVAAAGACAGFLVLHERCRAIEDERSAIAARMRTVQPTARRARM